MNKIFYILIIIHFYSFSYVLSQNIICEKLLPPINSANYRFGTALDFNDSVLVVGAPRENSSRGAVYTFLKTSAGWINIGKVLPPQQFVNDLFGFNLFLSENRLSVGAGTGLHIFNRFGTQFNETGIIPEIRSVFRIKNNWLIFGYAFEDYGGFSDAGAAYLYEYNDSSWQFYSRIEHPQPNNSAFFGYSVAVDSEFCLVGAPQTSLYGSFSGISYLFNYLNGSWLIGDTLIAKDIGPGYYFGFNVEIEENFLTVTAAGSINNPEFYSRVYLFKNSGIEWIERQVLFPIENHFDNGFGSQTLFYGDSLFITAPYDSVDGLRTGSVYLFERINDSWVQTFRYTPFDGSDNQLFGSSIDVKDGIIVIGSPGDNDRGTNSGSVYVYSKDVVGIEDLTSQVPEVFSLSQNYPNPFNPVTKIRYTIPASTIQGGTKNLVTLKVYDVLGNEVATLVTEFKNAGSYEVDFNASALSSGVYFYQLKAGNFLETKKMILLK